MWIRSRNHSYLYNEASICNGYTSDITPSQCNVRRGGTFDEGDSTTWEQTTTENVLEVDATGSQLDDLQGSDHVAINTTFSVDDVPLRVVRPSTQRRDANAAVNQLGLGNNSTFLAALYSAKAIASKTWSLALGWQGADSSHQTDGTLVLGGYDLAQADGSNSTWPFSKGTPCTSQLVVTISDIVLNFKNGTSAGILPPSAGTAIRACVTPEVPWLTMPDETFSNMLYLSGYAGSTPNRTKGINYNGMVFQADEIYDGDLTITLASGFEVRIPNHQLVIPDYAINTEGLIVETNPRVRELLINSLEGRRQDHMPLLGVPFLSSAYLLVDQDHEEFTLWNYDPTLTEKRLVPIGPNCSGGFGGVASSATTDSVPEASSGSRSLSAGSIVGIVLGSLAALVVIFVLPFLYYRRRKRLSHEAAPAADSNSDGGGNPQVSSSLGFKPELHAQEPFRSELPVERDTGYTLQPYEMGAQPDTEPVEEKSNWSSVAARNDTGGRFQTRSELA
ncbi:MAG: hypothetical protein Q9185_003847 [Variospora sp. 1 TL-2023]